MQNQKEIKELFSAVSQMMARLGTLLASDQTESIIEANSDLVMEHLGFPESLATPEELEKVKQLSKPPIISLDDVEQQFNLEGKFKQAAKDAELVEDESDEVLKSMESVRNSLYEINFSEAISNPTEYVSMISLGVNMRLPAPEGELLNDCVEAIDTWLETNYFDPTNVPEITDFEVNSDYLIPKITFTIPSYSNRKVSILFRYLSGWDTMLDTEKASTFFCDEFLFRKESQDLEADSVVLLYITSDGIVFTPRSTSDWDTTAFEYTAKVNSIETVKVRNEFNYPDGLYSRLNQVMDVYKGPNFDHSINHAPKGTGKDLNYYKQPGISSSLLRKFDGSVESVMDFVLREETWVRTKPMTLGRFGEDIVCGIPLKDKYFELPEGYKISENELAMFRMFATRLNEGKKTVDILDEFNNLGLYTRKMKVETLQKKMDEHSQIVGVLYKNPNIDFISYSDAVDMKLTIRDYVESIMPLRQAKVATQQLPVFLDYTLDDLGTYKLKMLPDQYWFNEKNSVLKITDIKVSQKQHLEAKRIVEDGDYMFQLAFYAFLMQQAEVVDFNKIILSNVIINLPKKQIDEISVKQWQLNREIGRIKMKLNLLYKVLNNNPNLSSKFK